MTTLALTITETLRYRGKLGQWSWVLHRISGLGTLLFFYLHVIDTSWAVFYPELYARAIALYQSPLFTAGEFGLVACVVYHALNGFRIVLFDWRPKWWKYQERAAQFVLLGTVIILIPTFLIMLREVFDHYSKVPFDLKLAELIQDNAPFVVGVVALLVGGVVLSAAYSVVQPKRDGSKLKRNRFDQIMWTYMRVSGVIIIPLVLGHLAMMHVLQGVFRLTEANYPVIGTLDINATGSAVEFVADRWNQVLAGVFIWRVYDVALLSFVVLHGFYGLHFVVNDYVHNKLVNRGFQLAVITVGVILFVVGGAAILAGVPHDAVKMFEGAKAAAQAVVP
jgi:succinate dehydrogenase / fumarate reductase cytochrome b subunit